MPALRKLPYTNPNEIVRKIRRFAANPRRGKKYANHFNELSSLQVQKIYSLLEKGMSFRTIAKIVCEEWGLMQQCSNTLPDQLSWILKQIMDDGENRATKTDQRVATLRKEESDLQAGIQTLETELVKKFNPLNELAFLADMQHQRIVQFRAAEKLMVDETCGETGDGRPQANKDIDSMVEKQRLLINEFVRSLKELREMHGESKPKDRTPRALSSVHVHLQGSVEHPKEMVTLIETYADDLDAFAVPASEVCATEANHDPT